MDQATREESLKLLAQVKPAPKSRFSALLLKIGAGYATMALFTAAALLYSYSNLYSINRTVRQLANTDLPVATALIDLRNSLLAQEGYAGKYAIFRDATFTELFHKRSKESVAGLAVLERTGSIGNIASLKRLYHDYQMASERLFAGETANRGESHASALRLVAALDALYIERQGMLQSILKGVDKQQNAAIRRTLVMSLAGFLIAGFIAPFCIYRVVRALDKLQKETHLIASGYFAYEPQFPTLAEISDLSSDFSEMVARIKEMERTNQEARPLTRLPGNLAIERVLNERLASGTPFSFCHVALDNFQPFLAQYGYAKAGELLHQTGVLIHCAVMENGAPRDLAGHAAGDCFVMVVSRDRVAAVCDAVVKGFDAEVSRHLSPEERAAGGFQRRDHCGVQRLFPLTTVSISHLDCSSDAYASAVEIARAAADIKDSLKKAPASNEGSATC